MLKNVFDKLDLLFYFFGQNIELHPYVYQHPKTHPVIHPSFGWAKFVLESGQSEI